MPTKKETKETETDKLFPIVLNKDIQNQERIIKKLDHSSL